MTNKRLYFFVKNLGTHITSRREGVDRIATIENYNQTVFEKNKNINEHDQEFWYTRDVQEVNKVSNHFVSVTKTIDMPKYTAIGGDPDQWIRKTNTRG